MSGISKLQLNRFGTEMNAMSISYIWRKISLNLLNFLLFCIAAIPLRLMLYLQEGVKLAGIGGGWMLIAAWFALLAVMMIQPVGYLLLSIVLVLIVILFLIPGLSWSRRLIWAALQLAACIASFWVVHILRLQPQHGPF